MRSIEVAKFDPWFLDRLAEIVAAEDAVMANGLPQDADGLASPEVHGLFGQASRLAGAALVGLA